MARNNGRWGRLRRVLNEDLSTTTPVCADTGADRIPGDTPRYGAGANIENHPQITDYVPRRFRITLLIAAAGAALGGVAEAIARNAELLSARVGVSPAELTNALSTQLVNWTSAITLLILAAYGRVIFLLKRHRLDDLRGRYRVWRQASLLAVVLSGLTVTSAHAVAARAFGTLISVHPWGSDVCWWVLPAAVVGGWVMVRILLDAAECRLALVCFVAASVCFLGAVTCSAGWLPSAWQNGADSLTRLLPLAGCLLSLAGTLLTARYVVLDVQGLIEHPTFAEKPVPSSQVARNTQSITSVDEPATAWIDGSEPDDDYTDDDRPLTKAERKRLKKQHGRYRAA